MRHLRKIALAAGALTLAATVPSLAQESEGPQASEDEDILVAGASEEEAEAEDEANEVICRREEPQVGTRLRARRTCMTRREWQQMEDETQRFLRQGSDSIGGAPNYPVTRGSGG